MKIAGCVFLIFCWAITCHGADSVTLRDNKVSVHLVSGSLVKTLETLHKKSGVEFVVKKGIENDRITIDLKQEELEPAIDKLLKNYNKNSEYSKGGKLRKVYVLSRKTKSASTVAADEPARNNTEGTDGLNAKQTDTPPEEHEEMEVLPVPDDADIPGKVEKNIGEMEVFESSEPGPGDNPGKNPSD